MRQRTLLDMKSILTLAWLIGLIVVAWAVLFAQPGPATLGHALYQAGYVRALYVPSESVSGRRTSPFDPSHPYTWDAASYLARYGHAITASKGSTVGERYSGDTVVEAVRAGCLPGWSPPAGWWPSDADRIDLMYVTRSGATAAYDDLRRCVEPDVVPSPTPVATAAPQPSPTPTVAPTPEPVPTATPCPTCEVCAEPLPCPTPAPCPDCPPHPPACGPMPPEVAAVLDVGDGQGWAMRRKSALRRVRQWIEGRRGCVTPGGDHG